MAQRSPRVSLYPVSCVNTSKLRPCKPGHPGIFQAPPKCLLLICLSSVRMETGHSLGVQGLLPDDLGALCDEKPILVPVPVQELGLCRRHRRPAPLRQKSPISIIFSIPVCLLCFFCSFRLLFLSPGPSFSRQLQVQALEEEQKHYLLPAALGWPGTKASLSCGETGACLPELRRPSYEGQVSAEWLSGSGTCV